MRKNTFSIPTLLRRYLGTPRIKTYGKPGLLVGKALVRDMVELLLLRAWLLPYTSLKPSGQVLRSPLVVLAPVLGLGQES